MITKVTTDTFESEVLNADRPVLVDYNADWCGPCKMLAPVIEALAGETPDVKFVSVNIDDEIDLALAANVSSIPCLVLYKNGAEASRAVGFRPKEDIRAFLKG